MLNKVIKSSLVDDAYFDKGREVMKILISNGQEAYMVGEVVRAKILNKPYRVIEIYTSAEHSIIEELFINHKLDIVDDDEYRLGYNGDIFKLYCYKTDVHIQTRKSVKIHYSRNLTDFLLRTDFTINALALTYNGRVIDGGNAYKDIKKKRVRIIGKPREHFNEKPERLLKAFSLVSELGFKINKKTLRGLKKSKAYTRIPLNSLLTHMKAIVSGKYFRRSFNYMVDIKVIKKIPFFQKILNRLDIKYYNVKWDEFLLGAFILNNHYNQEVAMTADDEFKLERAYPLAIANPKSEFDTFTLYRYGLELCLFVNDVNRICGKSKNQKRKIIKAYEELPIRSTCDLMFKGQDILKISLDDGGEYLISLVEEIEAAVLTQALPNEYDAIEEYVKMRLPEIKQTGKQVYIQEEKEEKFAYQGEEVEQPKSENKELKIDHQVPLTREEYNQLMDRLSKLEGTKLEDELLIEARELAKLNVPQGLSEEAEEASIERLVEVYRNELIQNDPKYISLKEKQ